MAARGAQVYASVALLGTLPASEVRERCEQLIVQVAGDRKSEAVIRGALAQACAMQGDFTRAREESERQRQMLAELGPSVTAMSTSIERARVETRAGDFTAAERELRADDASLAELGERYFRSTVVGMLAGVLVEAHRFEEAEAFVETARELADDDDTLSQVLWRTAWARMLAESGRAEEAIAVVERAVEIAAEGDDIDLLGDAKSALGEVLWRTGRQEAAEPPLREALALYERKEDVASASRSGCAWRRSPAARTRRPSVRFRRGPSRSSGCGTRSWSTLPFLTAEKMQFVTTVSLHDAEIGTTSPLSSSCSMTPSNVPTTTISHSRYGSCGAPSWTCTVAIWPVHVLSYSLPRRC